MHFFSIFNRKKSTGTITIINYKKNKYLLRNNRFKILTISSQRDSQKRHSSSELCELQSGDLNPALESTLSSKLSIYIKSPSSNILNGFL